MSCSTCNCNPCQCNCSCDPQNEALESAFNNFTADFIGTITKTCVNGSVVWTLPCDLDGEFVGIAKGVGESILCYWQRAIQQALSTSIALPISVANGGTGGTTAAEARTNLDVQQACANLDSWCLITPPVGNVVGTTDSQTLSNKTFTNASNTMQTLTDQATIAWDANLGSIATVALGANRAMGAPTNLHPGTYILITTGAFAITSWDAIFDWGAGLAPVGGGTKNVYTFIYNGTKLTGAGVTSVA